MQRQQVAPADSRGSRRSAVLWSCGAGTVVSAFTAFALSGLVPGSTSVSFLLAVMLPAVVTGSVVTAVLLWRYWKGETSVALRASMTSLVKNPPDDPL